MCAFHSLHTEFFNLLRWSKWLLFMLLHGVQKSCATRPRNKLFFAFFPWKIRYFPFFYLFFTIFPLFHIVATVGSQRRALFTCFQHWFYAKIPGWGRGRPCTKDFRLNLVAFLHAMDHYQFKIYFLLVLRTSLIKKCFVFNGLAGIFLDFRRGNAPKSRYLSIA